MGIFSYDFGTAHFGRKLWFAQLFIQIHKGLAYNTYRMGHS